MKQKKQILISILCIVIILSVVGLMYYLNIKNSSYKDLNITFKNSQEVYEVETKLDAISFIKSTSKNITDIQYPKIDTSQIGEHAYLFIAFDKFGNQKEFPLILTFVDPILPELELSKYEISIVEDESIELEKLVVKAEDPLDGKLEVNIKKPKDYLKVGTHKIKYSIKDKNGNLVEKELILTVTKKEIKKPNEEESKSSQPSNEINQNQPEQNTPGNVDSITNNIPGNTTVQTPGNKKFLFSDGYDMLTAPKACASYIFEENGAYVGYKSCVNLYGDDGLPIGQEAIFR